MGRDLVRVAVYQSITMRRRMIRVPYISIYSGLRRGTRLWFLRLFRYGGPPAKEYLWVATAVSSCETSIILEELGRSGKKLLGERKIEPTSMRGASDDLPPVYGAICMYVYRCGGSSCGDVVCVVVFTLQSAVTGQAPISLEWKITSM